MVQATQEAVKQILSEVTTDRTQFLQFCERVIGSAKRAGVTEQQLLDQIHNWYESGDSNQSGGTGSGGGAKSNR